MLVKKFQKHLKSKDPVPISGVLQSWWVIEKCVEGPESSNTFCEVVGVLKKKVVDLQKPYRQTEALVLTNKIGSWAGVSLSWKPQFGIGMHMLMLSPIDYNHSIFPGWD